MAGRWMQSPEGRAFGLGLGAALAGIILWPAVRRSARPVLKTAVKSVLSAGTAASVALSEMRETVEDVVAEAHFERLRGQVAEPPGKGGVATDEPRGTGAATD